MPNDRTLRLALATLLSLAGGCATSLAPPAAERADAEMPDARAGRADGRDARVMDAGSDADPPSAAGCDDDLVRDGAFCIGWRWAAPSQRCLEGQPELVVTDVVPPWTDRALLAVECSEEAPQLYSPGEDRWRRAPEVATWPTEALDLEGTPPDLLAAGALPDATVVALAGSLHAHGPFAAWIAEPGGEGWRRSIDVPWVNPIGAAALSDDSLLFAGDESLILVLRPAR